MRVSAILTGLAIFAAGAAYAEPHEFIACNFREHKGTADLDKWVASIQSVLDSTQDDYRAVVLTPQYDGGDATPDFYWMGVWPDAQKLGLGLANWFEKGTGDKAMVALAAFADCKPGPLWWGRQVYQQK